MKKNLRLAEKGFHAYKKAYPTNRDGFNEIITNNFFAPERKNIKLNFVIDTNKPWFSVTNDGLSMSQTEIENALTVLGCESKNTPGNENGTGLKSSASLFTQHNDDSILFLLSKKNGKTTGIGGIGNDGMYYEAEDLSSEQTDFVNNVLSTFTNGTSTAVFNTKLDEEEVDELINYIPYMFTSGLDNVLMTYQINNGNEYTINSFDRHYRHLDYVRYKEETVNFSYKIHNKNKIFKATIISTDMLSVKPDDYLYLDETNGDFIDDFGVHMGYDDGYMPLCRSQVESLAYKSSQPQYNKARHSIIAHPIENSDEYAGYNEWKIFYSTVGKMSPQKVSGLNSPFNYKRNGKIAPKWESFYETVIQFFKDNTNDWMPKIERTTEDKFSVNKMENLNKLMEKYSHTHCDTKWNFKLSTDVDEIVKFDKKNKTVLFNYSDESPLINILLKGGRNGRNGDNDLDKTIRVVVDVFKMDIDDEKTTDGVVKAIKRRVRKYNNYYSI